MSLPLKAGGVTLAIGTVTGISAGLGTYFGRYQDATKKGKLLSELIEEQYEYILLTANDKWEDVWKKYETENTNKKKGEDELKLPSWPSRDQDKLIPELKQKCQELSKNTGNTIGDNLYQKITKYCSRGVTLKEEAVKKRLAVANTKGDKSLWENRQKRRADLHDDLARIGVKVLGGSVSPEIIANHCEKTEVRNKQDKDYKRLYTSYEKVCIKHDDDPK